MLKRIKLKNSTLLILGFIIVGAGICIGLYEYFEERKNDTFSNMNIMLYESELPENIINDNEEELLEEENKIEKEEISENNQEQVLDTPNYTGILEIPEINLKRGFYNIGSRYNNVDYNITVINGSTFPEEQNNNLILAAHSGYCTVCYFDKLYKLSINDKAYVYYNNNKYTYKIVNIYEEEKDGTVAIHRDYNKSTLTLITCTRNSDTKQTVYILELV